MSEGSNPRSCSHYTEPCVPGGNWRKDSVRSRDRRTDTTIEPPYGFLGLGYTKTTKESHFGL